MWFTFQRKIKKTVIFSIRGLRPVLTFLFPEEKCDISKQTNLFLTTVVLEKWLKPAAVFTERLKDELSQAWLTSIWQWPQSNKSMIQYVQRYCSSYLCKVSCVRHKSVGVAQVGRNERKFKAQVRDVVHLWLSWCMQSKMIKKSLWVEPKVKGCWCVAVRLCNPDLIVVFVAVLRRQFTGEGRWPRMNTWTRWMWAKPFCTLTCFEKHKTLVFQYFGTRPDQPLQVFPPRKPNLLVGSCLARFLEAFKTRLYFGPAFLRRLLIKKYPICSCSLNNAAFLTIGFPHL